MAKIDCSATVNFLKEWRRMCDSLHNCSNCALGMRDEFGFNRCKASDNPEFTIEIIQKWSDEHPVKTRLDDLLEKYPKYKFYGSDQCPSAHPAIFGYCDTCTECINKKQTLRYCWHEPVDGGATGKAVE